MRITKQEQIDQLTAQNRKMRAELVESGRQLQMAHERIDALQGTSWRDLRAMVKAIPPELTASATADFPTYLL